MTIAPNRAVAVLTPLVFAPLAGAVSVLIADKAPGLDIDKGSLETIFVAGATIAFAKAALWLKGWQDFEKREQSASLANEPAPVADAFDELRHEFDAPVEIDDEAEIDEEAEFDDGFEIDDEAGFDEDAEFDDGSDDDLEDESAFDDDLEFDEDEALVRGEGRNGQSLASAKAG